MSKVSNWLGPPNKNRKITDLALPANWEGSDSALSNLGKLYRAWEGRTAAAFFDCSKAKRLLGWQPTSDIQALVAAGIRAPALEFVA